MNITKAIVQLRGQLVRDINRAGLPPGYSKKEQR